MRLEVLNAAGLDTADALARLMGSEALLGRLLGKFAADENCARLAAAAEKDDADAALEAAHALKGVSGNLSMTRLYELTARQCELIRGGDWPAARALVDDVVAEHDALVAAIADALETKGTGSFVSQPCFATPENQGYPITLVFCYGKARL